MAQTVIGLFNSRQEAERALNQLLSQGFSQADVDLSTAGGQGGNSSGPSDDKASNNPWNTGKSWAPGVTSEERPGKTPKMADHTTGTSTGRPGHSGSSNANFSQENRQQGNTGGRETNPQETAGLNDSDDLAAATPRTGMGGTSGVAGSTGLDANAGRDRWRGDDTGPEGDTTNSTGGTTSTGTHGMPGQMDPPGEAGERRDYTTDRRQLQSEGSGQPDAEGAAGGYPGRDRSANTGIDRNITSYIRSLFADDDAEAERYASAAGRCSVITVKAPDRGQAERAAEILDSNGAVDVDEVKETGSQQQQPGTGATGTMAAGPGIGRMGGRRSRIFDHSFDENNSLERNQSPESRKNTEENRGM